MIGLFIIISFIRTLEKFNYYIIKIDGFIFLSRICSNNVGVLVTQRKKENNISYLTIR